VLTYVVRRLLYSVVVLVAASFLIFCFVSLAGDPLATLKMRPGISQETIRNIEQRKHLDQPIPVRYVYWVDDAVTHQFGTTINGDKPILPDLLRVMGNTLQLVVVAQLLAILLGVAIGVYSALRQYSPFDYTATTFTFIGLATPDFWLALMLQVLVVKVYQSTGHHIFPVTSLSSVNPGTGVHFVLDRAWHLVLPVAALIVISVASYSRYMRAAMLEVVGSDYVRTARAKGVSERVAIMRHAFRNALIPLVTIVALGFGALLSGVVVLETVFGLDGMGLYYTRALQAGDPYPVMAWLMVTAVMIIVFNLIADIAYGYLDPRVRIE
jgi:ABC-type dipeptide/oligopeptide/nickel transport system permease component